MPASTRALRRIAFPVQALGHYRVARRFVPAATTLAGILWEGRFPTAGKLAVIKRIVLRGLQVGAPTAAIEDQFTLSRATGFTAADATGSAAITPGAGKQKVRTTMDDALLILREANVAAGASGGTKTIDTDPLATGSMWVLAALSAAQGSMQEILRYEPDIASGEHPLVCAPDEGWVLENKNAFGTASGIILQVEIDWLECLTAQYAA
jgi:hypothetical protein